MLLFLLSNSRSYIKHIYNYNKVKIFVLSVKLLLDCKEVVVELFHSKYFYYL